MRVLGSTGLDRSGALALGGVFWSFSSRRGLWIVDVCIEASHDGDSIVIHLTLLSRRDRLSLQHLFDLHLPQPDGAPSGVLELPVWNLMQSGAWMQDE